MHKMPREEKLKIVSELQEHLLQEWDLEVGELAAELLLDKLSSKLYPFIYNQAIADCRQLLEMRMNSLEEDLYALQRPVPSPERD
ncbi:DUF2164 family protein [Paenibacillus senegalensis]|uniref:DUF2164 family protein n=1 Tax=Paenibacillus senegalensis TaxID=1465766 RepID=UPI00028A0C9E|nr:DUF2164 family protein [Paenibacillus senegalensis]